MFQGILQTKFELLHYNIILKYDFFLQCPRPAEGEGPAQLTPQRRRTERVTQLLRMGLR